FVVAYMSPASTSHTSVSLFVYCYSTHRDLHAFPTRRSSDLKLTVRLTRLLPTTLPSVTQVEPSQAWTVKSVMPYTLKVRLSVGSDRTTTRLNSSHVETWYVVFSLLK